jgi:aldose 1-epimerase
MRFAFTLISFIAACSAMATTVESQPWGTLKSGEAVELWTLRNAAGCEARIATWGGILVSLKVPDRTGALGDVVLGKDSLADYEAGHPHFGCITGRYANRIGGAKFSIDGVEHHVTMNSGKNHIHGGKAAFDKKVWKAQKIEQGDAAGVSLRYRSADGEEGFPGTLDCTVDYTLNEANELTLTYQATTDKPTVVNLTNHSYFNLAGEGSGTALKHELTLPCPQITATDDSLIPIGQLLDVKGTPLDFTTPTAIGARIDADHPALVQGKGYDHNYVIPGSGLRLAARVSDPASGRVMEVRTTAPGVQLYTANHLKDVLGKHGHRYQRRDAFCLETQCFPDTPNQPLFPTALLRPGQAYHHQTVFRFRAVP